MVHGTVQAQTVLHLITGGECQQVLLISSAHRRFPVKTRQLVEFMQHQIMEGGFSPFSGELYSQDGIVQSDDNRSLTPEEIINMRWLADNVNGSLPHWNKLK